MASLLLRSQAAATEPPPQKPVKQPRYRIPLGPQVDPFHHERIWALSLVVVAGWYLRAWDPVFSTAYTDESVPVLYGRMFLARVFEFPLNQPMRHMFGWYLWPILAALADKVLGIVGVRELSAFLGMLAIIGMYNFARRLFTPEIGLASAAVYAVAAPAIFSSRIATPDSGAINFLLFGLWAYVHAWREKSRRAWVVAAVLIFAAFLCKYVVFIFLPGLILLALKQRAASLKPFVIPLVAAVALYVGYYRNDLLVLLVSDGRALQARTGLLGIYLFDRIDFWFLILLGALALVPRDRRALTGLLLGGAALLMLYQWAFRADYDFWKNATYALLFVIPAAAAACISLADWLGHSVFKQTAFATILMAVVVAITARTGHALRMEHFVFWPNVTPITAVMENQIAPHDRILVDDSVFRYYFSPPLWQQHISDPFTMEYHGLHGGSAYIAAVQDGYFDYILLDGGYTPEARAMRAAILPSLAEKYVRHVSMPEPVLKGTLEIYERKGHTVSPVTGPHLEITSPTSGSMVVASNGLEVRLTGRVVNAPLNWKITSDVYTDRWYWQNRKPLMHEDGTFEQTIFLGGEGEAQCHHLLRVRLLDEYNHELASTVQYEIVRLDAPGKLPACAAESGMSLPASAPAASGTSPITQTTSAPPPASTQPH